MPDDLTQQEIEGLRQMLAEHNARNAKWEFVKSLPVIGQFIGSVGKYAVYLTFVSGVITALLLPKRIEEVYHYFQPIAPWAIAKLEQVLAGPPPSEPVPETQDYYVLRTQKTPYPTIIASTTFNENLIPHSGVVPPPSSTL